jgi:phosphosulfolactate synthase
VLAQAHHRPPVTHVLDRGLTLAALDKLLRTAGAHIDFVKLGWGTAYASADLPAKVARCDRANVRACLGGTLLELAWAQERMAEYVRWAHGLGVSCVEVSNGSVDMPAAEKRRLIQELADEFEVLAEVGSKRPGPVDVPRWCDEMTRDLDAGASWLVAEGRESGTVGLFEPNGDVRVELVEAIAAAVPVDGVIFEAPLKAQQAVLIDLVGPKAGLGNIAPGEVLSVEMLRRAAIAAGGSPVSPGTGAQASGPARPDPWIVP